MAWKAWQNRRGGPISSEDPLFHSSAHGMIYPALANQSGVPPTTVYSMLNAKSKNPGIVTIQKLCDGLNISVREFFDDSVFEGLEQAIR